MNCDQAFDCITDPARRDSSELEEHLAQCARCRQMHETLEPALDMFDELVPEPDFSNSGIATQTLAPESVRVAEQAASRLQATGGRTDRWRRGLILRYAAASMAGALLMGVMGSINNVDSTDAGALPLTTTEFASPIPDVFAPAANDVELPAPGGADCMLATGTIDREAYPTPTAVVRRCAECHRNAEDALFPGNAQPISIERPGEIEETADLIVRVLSMRERTLMLAEAPLAPHGALPRLV